MGRAFHNFDCRFRTDDAEGNGGRVVEVGLHLGHVVGVKDPFLALVATAVATCVTQARVCAGALRGSSSDLCRGLVGSARTILLLGTILLIRVVSRAGVSACGGRRPVSVFVSPRSSISTAMPGGARLLNDVVVALVATGVRAPVPKRGGVIGRTTAGPSPLGTALVPSSIGISTAVFGVT